VKPATADSLYFNNKASIADREISKPDINNGSNNWWSPEAGPAAARRYYAMTRTFDLKLPSIWYEMQLFRPNSSTTDKPPRKSCLS